MNVSKIKSLAKGLKRRRGSYMYLCTGTYLFSCSFTVAYDHAVAWQAEWGDEIQSGGNTFFGTPA